MLSDKDRKALAAVRDTTDYFTVKRRRKEISEHQKGLEDYDG